MQVYGKIINLLSIKEKNKKKHNLVKKSIVLLTKGELKRIQIFGGMEGNE